MSFRYLIRKSPLHQYMVHTVPFLPKLTLKLHKYKMLDLGVASQHRKWDEVLQGETYIDDGVFHNLP